MDAREALRKRIEQQEDRTNRALPQEKDDTVAVWICSCLVTIILIVLSLYMSGQ